MALPTNKIKKIKLPNSTEAYEIIPERLQNNGFEASLPTLSTNSTIALLSDIPRFKTVNGNSIIGSGDLEIKPSRPDIIEALTNKISEETYPSLYDRDSIRVRSDGDDYQTALKSNGFNLYNMGVSDEPVAIDLQYKSGTVALTSDIPTTLPDYNLGYYDTMVENSDGTYTITRQTGYIDLGSLEWALKEGSGYWFWQTSFVKGQKTVSSSSEVVEGKHAIYNATSSNNYGAVNNTFYWNDANLIIRTSSTTERPSGILQYKLATSYTEKVEKNHYAVYNQKFILDHNKNEAERSANLFNNPYNYSGTNNGVSINIVGNECVLSGTSTNGFYQTLGYFNLKAGTYTYNQVVLSGSINGNISQVRFGLHKGGSDLFPLGETTGTYTLTEDTSVDIVVWFGTSGMTFNNCKLTFMLNKGSKPLPYQPYEGKVIHKKDITDLYENAYNLGYYDTLIDNDDGTYTITRQTGYLKLDGAKYKFNRVFSSNEKGLFSFELTNKNISKPANNGIVGDIICNRFGTYSVNYLRNNKKYGIGIDDGGDIVVCLTKSISTLDDANAYLVKNPISIQYKLPTNKTSYIYKNLSKNGRIYPNQYNVNKTYKSELTENGYKLTFTASATEGNPSWDAFLVDFDKTEKYESLTVRFEVIKSDVPLNECLFQFNDWGETEAENNDALIQHYFSIGDRTGIIEETFTVNKDLTKGLGSIGLGFDRTPGAGDVEILIKEISLNKKNGFSSYIATPEKIEVNHFARYNEQFILDHNKNEAERSANLYSGVQSCSGIDTKTYFDARINFFNNSTLISTIWFNKQITNGYTPVTFNFTKPTNANKMKFGHGGSTKDVEIDYDISNLPNGNYSLSFVVTSYEEPQAFNKIMLNEGAVALPYQPYEGKVVHEKELESITQGIYKKVATNQSSYSLAYGKTYKIKMNSDSYAYCSAISNANFYGTFEISNFTIEYTPDASGPSGTQMTLPEYQYILCSSGARYAEQSSNTIQGFSTKYSKVSITLTANKGTFDVYELN